ncbi:Hypothetical protein CINCED_3A003067 [Cinara cedri]|uniref:Uncharacterized protein n=1 Tax=Cinara cedri TaxID=506608 RepID=A0A5E4MI03_9HEMI|nr:Hypothetical protein CINCED_3A003067 [Cinara cedri]
MNATVFEKWFINMLGGNLEKPCIIDMDNVSHHTILAEDYPQTNTRKAKFKNGYKKNQYHLLRKKHCANYRKK